MRKSLTIIFVIILSIHSQDPLLETSFETDPIMNQGWTVQTSGAGWIHYSKNYSWATVNTGEYSMAHMDITGPQDDWLISPVLSLPADSSLSLSFWETSMFVQYIGLHEVCVTTDGGTTWTRIISTVPEQNKFNKIILRLNDFLGRDVQIGWHYIGDYSDQWFIDDVMLVYDDQPPYLTKIIAETSLLPVIGTYAGNDMEIEIEIFDKSIIALVKGYYSFDGGVNFDEVNFKGTENRFIWTGTVPARNILSAGMVHFYLKDEYGNSHTSENYEIKFINDYLEPEIINVRGTLVMIGDNADISVTFKDFSKIASCIGHYSKDNFVTQYDFNLSPEKINFYSFKGVIPAENESVNNGKLKFTIVDINGNKLTSDTYSIKWIESYSQLRQFDLRTSLNKNYITPIKEQWSGTCWLFSTCAAIESNLLMTGNWETSGEDGVPDISESHLSWWMGFNKFFNEDIDPPAGSGLAIHNLSSYYVAAAYLTRGEGAVRQSDASSFNEPPERYSEFYHYYYARDIEWYSMDNELNGIETIKQKIVEYGSVGVGLLHSSFDPDTFIHYQSPQSPLYLSHGVTIVGWDDDKITQAPEGPGAWYCKNHWGVDFGFDGFYWVSYYDKFAGKGGEGGAVSFHNVERMKYDAVYYHDYHGYSAVLPDVSEAFNAFTLRQGDDGWLSAVNIFNAVNDVDYTIKVYKKFTEGELSSKVSSVSGHFDYLGYHTIDLKEKVYLNEGDQFYIYLYLSDGGQPIDQNFFIQTAYLTYQSSASPGESFYFENGEWKDLYYNTSILYQGTANFCIKGLMIRKTELPETELPGSTNLFQNYPNPFNPVTTISYSIEKTSHVEMNIYNINGQFIKNLINKKHEPGLYYIDFNAYDLNSGLYFGKLKVDGNVIQTRKMMLIK